MVPEITVQELAALREKDSNFLLLDVRNSNEVAICTLEGKLIPYPELETRFTELDPEQHIIIYCHGGGRSSRATLFLIQQGFKKVFNLRGGITAWANEIDTTMAKY